MDLPRYKDYVLDLQVGDPDLVRFMRGNITEVPADAIVNAANSELLPGSGVCGAIHHAGGPTIAEECRRVRSERGQLSAGQAVTTTAGLLQAKCVIHTVGPVWHGGDQGEADLLSSCYRESMRLADERKLHSIAFPAISTGVFGYPVEQAAWVAVPTVIESLRSAKNLVLVLMVLFDKDTLDVFARTAVAQRKPASGRRYEIAILS
jgi:O-acetyl-ADP-ribose deacetylase (regulator of RNase III)